MNTDHIIITESNRPFWQIPVASLFFTVAIGLMIFGVFNLKWNDKTMLDITDLIRLAVVLSVIGVAFCYQKYIYINLKESKFRSTFQIGPIKLGQWKTITNYEYVSIFNQPLIDGDKIFEVNLWYNNNQHWELYERHDFREAFKIAFELSELLNIDLLDATTPSDYKWIDKEEWKQALKDEIPS